MSNSNIYCQLLYSATLLVALTGCTRGPALPATVPAEGVLTLDGKAVENCSIMFIAEQGTYNATGTTDANGQFAMNAFTEKRGAVAGKYKVEFNKTIVENKGEKKGESVVALQQGMPKKYLSIGTSGISFEVPSSGSKDIKFELKSK